MTNNDILRRMRYIFSFSDDQMIEVFSEGDLQVKRDQICDWLKKDDDPDFREISDPELAIFLNGFINLKRGRKEGDPPIPESTLNNNIIFRKLRIALNLQADDVMEILNSAEVYISKHELSAFFRKPGHKHYRQCKDQILRNFLKGLELNYHSGE